MTLQQQQLLQTPSGTIKTGYLHNLSEKFPLVFSQEGKAHIVVPNEVGNPFVLRIGSAQANQLIRQTADNDLRKHELESINEYLIAEARKFPGCVWSRVAPISGGIEIDTCNTDNTRIRVAAGKVEVLGQGSEALFYRNLIAEPLVLPAAIGNINLLKQYVNLSPVDYTLFLGWLSYTLATPKFSSTNYVILVLQGDQGSGKSFMCRHIISNLIDPSRVPVQAFPRNAKDLSIAATHAHVLCYDNMRNFNSSMSDVLCMTSTGGALSNRMLYTDGEQNIHQLHVALVLNGIHSFIQQADLAQRCLAIRTLPMSESNRRSEADMVKQLKADLPVIFRGLLDLIAGIFQVLPNVNVTHPARMLDFVKWLAAMESVHGAPEGAYQKVYCDSLDQVQLDTLMDNQLAATLIEFVDRNPHWTGTPTELLRQLEFIAADGAKRSREWPNNPITLSKRLNALKASLLTQGIGLELSRGKQRTITLKTL